MSTSPAAALSVQSSGMAALRGDAETAEVWFDRCDGRLPTQLAWLVGVERCIARAERGDLEGAQSALAEGAEATDAGSRAGRAIASAYCRALQLGRGEDEDEDRSFIEAAILDGRSVPDPVVVDLVDRLCRFLDR